MQKEEEVVSNQRAIPNYYERLSYKQQRRCASVTTKENERLEREADARIFPGAKP